MQFPAPKSDIFHAGGVTSAGKPMERREFAVKQKTAAVRPPGWTEPVPCQKGEPEGTG